MKSKLKYFLVITFSVFVISGLSYKYLYKPDNEIVAQTEYAFNISDKSLLVDYAENVFVGTVLEQKDGVTDEAGVYTPYNVSIDNILKGDLTLGDNLVISQRIGYDNNLKATVKLEEDDEFLQVGNSYVFSIAYDNHEDIHRIVAPVYGNVQVKDARTRNSSLDTAIINEFKDVINEN